MEMSTDTASSDDRFKIQSACAYKSQIYEPVSIIVRTEITMSIINPDKICLEGKIRDS